MKHVQDILAIIGALYTLLTAIGNAWPKGRVGAVCTKAALVLRKVTQ